MLLDHYIVLEPAYGPGELFTQPVERIRGMAEEAIKRELLELQVRILLLDDYLVLELAYGIGKLFSTPFEKIRDTAEEELYGEEKIKQELLELQMNLEMDEITEEEYMAAETVLMQRLDEGRRLLEKGKLWGKHREEATEQGKPGRGGGKPKRRG
ncbi:unnamed protein product [marine sediment metagenome]|uniref:Uncharacterized protein n=1 Tax=marine sediment metagenome TaxID=412755 RepID=X0TDP4_9ZZZZ